MRVMPSSPYVASNAGWRFSSTERKPSFSWAIRAGVLPARTLIRLFPYPPGPAFGKDFREQPIHDAPPSGWGHGRHALHDPDPRNLFGHTRRIRAHASGCGPEILVGPADLFTHGRDDPIKGLHAMRNGVVAAQPRDLLAVSFGDQKEMMVKEMRCRRQSDPRVRTAGGITKPST